MQGEQSSNQQAAARKARSPPQRHEQKHNIQTVEQQAGEVMTAGIRTVKLPVQSVRKPAQRVPVICFRSRPCPTESIPREPGPDVQVSRDVLLIVVIEEGVIPNWTVERRGDYKNEASAESVLCSCYLHPASIALPR